MAYREAHLFGVLVRPGCFFPPFLSFLSICRKCPYGVLWGASDGPRGLPVTLGPLLRPPHVLHGTGDVLYDCVDVTSRPKRPMTPFVPHAVSPP